MNVWVTRPLPGLRTTAAVLRSAGHAVVEAPVLEVATITPDPRPASPPAWIIFVSANAVRGFLDAGLHPGNAHFAAVGRRTAEIAREIGYQAAIVPENECAEGLLAELAHEAINGKHVWIPAGDRPGSANRDLPEALARLGATVEVFRVYQTRDRPLSTAELEALACEPGAMVVHSPSAAEAVFTGPCPTAITPWRERAVAIAIGPVTRVRLEQLGVTHIAEAPEPSDSGVLTTLAAIAENKS